MTFRQLKTLSARGWQPSDRISLRRTMTLLCFAILVALRVVTWIVLAPSLVAAQATTEPSRTESTQSTASIADAALPEAGSRQIFVDVSTEVGFDFLYWNGMTGARHFPEAVGNGGALLDIDNDGDLDIYMVQGGRLDDAPLSKAPIPRPASLSDRLWRNDLENGDLENRGDTASTLRFVDITVSGLPDVGDGDDGYGMGVATGDIDNDGWVDLYITNFGANRMLRNRGDGSFEDITEKSGTADRSFSISASFADIDNDGLLDLYVANYVEFSTSLGKVCRSMAGVVDYCGPAAFKHVPDKLYRNLGGGRFDDISTRSGIGRTSASGLGVVARDFNDDGRVDFYVANDGSPNQLWTNAGDGTFADDALFAGTAVNELGRSEASMGIAVADFDRDGDDDIFLTHLVRETNTLYRNDGGGFFEDYTVRTGVSQASWNYTSFGTRWLDFDNDGWLDLATVSGAVHLGESEGKGDDFFLLDQPNQLFHNLGNGRLVEVTQSAGPAFASSEVSRGLSSGDIDNDGDADLLVINNSAPSRLLENRVGQEARWIGLSVRERGRDAIGARVEIQVEGRSHWHTVATDGSYASASDPRILIGLGAEPQGSEKSTSTPTAAGARAIVHWPGGGREVFDVVIGAYTVAEKGRGSSAATKP